VERLLAATRSGLRRPVRALHSARPEERHSAQRPVFPEPHLALPERRSESHCPAAVRHAARVAHPSRGSRVVAEFESAERRRAVRPVPKATALHPRVEAEAAVEFESAEQPRVAGSMPEAKVLQRRAAAAPGSARSFAEAGARQARRLAESEPSAAQAAAVLPAASDAAVVLLRAEAAAPDVVEAPRQEAEARDVAAVLRPEEEAEVRVGAAVLRPEAAAQAGVAEVARQPAARDAAAVLRRAARGAQALPSAAVLPCRLRVRLAPQPAARFARAMKRL
jgi:hypothetical protein